MPVIYLNPVPEQTPLTKATHLLQGHSPWTNLGFSTLLKGMIGIASTLISFHFTKKWKFCHVGPLTRHIGRIN